MSRFNLETYGGLSFTIAAPTICNLSLEMITFDTEKSLLVMNAKKLCNNCSFLLSLGKLLIFKNE